MRLKKHLLYLIPTLLLAFNIQSSFADDGVVVESKENSIQILNENISLYSDKELKNKLDIIDKGTPIAIISKSKTYIVIKYDDKTYYINAKDLDNAKIQNNDTSVASEDNKDNGLKKDEISISESSLTDDITISPLYDTQSELLYSIASPSQPEYTSGEKLDALFTSYYPENSLLQGGFHDALGRRLNPNENTIAAPKEIPFGTQVQIEGTGTYMDGKIFTVRDRGGAIKKRGDQYQFDILSSNRLQAYSWGRRTGYVRIVRWGW